MNSNSTVEIDEVIDGIGRKKLTNPVAIVFTKLEYKITSFSINEYCGLTIERHRCLSWDDCLNLSDRGPSKNRRSLTSSSTSRSSSLPFWRSLPRTTWRPASPDSSSRTGGSCGSSSLHYKIQNDVCRCM